MADILRREIALDSISDLCCLYGRERESIDHLFVHCDVASSIWEHLLKLCGVDWCVLGSLAELFEA